MKKLVLITVITLGMFSLNVKAAEPLSTAVAVLSGLVISEFAHSSFNTPLPACVGQPSVTVKADNGNYFFERAACDIKK